MSSPSPIDTSETTRASLTTVWNAPDEEEKKDKYKQEFLGTEAGVTSQCVVKQSYLQESKYTKSRKIKSMPSGWED